jgi:hypothetical protein
VDIAPERREKLERLCRYVSCPPVATERLALTASGQGRYTLKTPYRDGTTHLVLEPLDLMARLAALVPPPRRHLTRFHGVFAPHSQLRAAVTPAHRGVGAAKQPVADPAQPPPPRHVAMGWAQRLKRVFGIEIDTCQRCGGTLSIVASIEYQRRARSFGRETGARRQPFARVPGQGEVTPDVELVGTRSVPQPIVQIALDRRPITRIGPVGTGGPNFHAPGRSSPGSTEPIALP